MPGDYKWGTIQPGNLSTDELEVLGDTTVPIMGAWGKGLKKNRSRNPCVRKSGRI